MVDRLLVRGGGLLHRPLRKLDCSAELIRPEDGFVSCAVCVRHVELRKRGGQNLDVWIEHLVLISRKKLSSLKPAVTAAAKCGNCCKRESEKFDQVKYGGVSQCGLD